MSPRICVVTAGHLSTCPRMLKAADALAGEGYEVRVVSTRHVAWATRADEEVRRARHGLWEWTVVDYARGSAARTHFRSGLRSRVAQALARKLGARRSPSKLAAWAYSRSHSELLRAALARPADLYYGGTTGALAAVAAAGRRQGVPYALDLEDFHSAEREDGEAGRLANALAERIERRALPGAVLLTAASQAIAAAYADKYDLRPLTINNAGPLPQRAPDLSPSPGDGLRMYWFSQTIGPGRGLEDAVRAASIGGIAGELHLRGQAMSDYVDSLRRLTERLSSRLRITHHEPAPPDAMTDLCAGYDVGLSLEQEHVLNRALCLTNKAFTYMLGGLAIAFTDTPGQRPLALDVGEGAVRYKPGDVGALAVGLRRWSTDKSLLGRAKAATWAAARRRWHWEHPDERGALIGAVRRIFR